MASNKQQPINPLGDTFAPIAEPIHSTSKKRAGIKVILWIVIVVVLVGAGAGGWFWWQGQQSKKMSEATTTKSAASTVDAAKVSQVQQEAAVAANTASGGSVSQGVKIYDQAIRSTPASDTATTSSLYSGEAQLLFNNNQAQDALGPAQKAVQLNPTAMNYGLLGTIYVQLGRKDDALATFKSGLAAANALTSDGGAGKSSMTQYFTQQIQQLEGS